MSEMKKKRGIKRDTSGNYEGADRKSKENERDSERNEGERNSDEKTDRENKKEINKTRTRK